MAITQAEAKKLLKDLSAKTGGSIVGRVSKSELNSSSRVLFIGIGGMGCKTVNAIKGVYSRKFRQTPDVRFLAIDTALNDMKELRLENGGNLSSEECFELYDSSASHLLINPPHTVRSWLSSDVPAETIDESGAKSRRAVGRVILCGTNKYVALETTIRNKLSAFTTGTIEVVVCAGVSGGTGSGTFIDISYMVRRMLTELNRDRNRDTRLYGVFYTPDVQKSIPAIGGDPAKWNALQTNGYAAMKELNYFMGIGSPDHIKNVYEITLPDGSTRASNESIFDRGRVFIVSVTANMNACEDIIESTAESLMNMFKTGSVEGKISQSMISTLCNLTQNLGQWEIKNVGVQADQSKDEDPSGIRNCRFPVFMDNNFSAFGFRSIYFPRNEMAAYCANTVFKAVLDEYDKAFSFSQEDIFYLAGICGVSSADEILKSVKNEIQITNETFRIRKGTEFYPIRKGFIHMGKVEGLEDTMRMAKDLVDQKVRSVTGLDVSVENVFNTIRNLIEGRTTFYSDGASINYWDQFGPYGGMVFLTGNENANVRGLTDLLTDMKDSLQGLLNDQYNAVNSAEAAMKAAMNTLASDRTPHDEEIEVFIDACQAYSNAYFDYSFTNSYMWQYLDLLNQRLIGYNNETFAIYVPIIQELSRILNEDSDIFVRNYLTETAEGKRFSLNAFDLDQAMTRNDLFGKMFDGYIADSALAKDVHDKLKVLLFGSEQRNNWKQLLDQPELLTDELRHVFEDVTRPLVSSMLEKFIVLVYGDRHAIVAGNNGSDQIGIEQLEAIWNNEELRNNALDTAARMIVGELTNSALISFELPPNDVTRFSKAINIILLNETPNLNEHIRSILDADPSTSNRYNLATIGNDTVCQYATEITMFETLYPFAFELVRNIKNYAEQYFFSEKGVDTAAGRHLDEVTEQWQRYLPEIYGVDTEDYYVSCYNRPAMAINDNSRAVNEDGSVKNNDIEVYSLIRKAVEYGIQNEYIFVDAESGNMTATPHYSMLCLKDFSPAFIGRMVSLLLSGRSNISNWRDALRQIEETEHRKYSELVRLDEAINNKPLISKQTISPLGSHELKNVYRVVRSDMKMTKLVIETMEKYEKEGFFHYISNATVFSDQVKYFIQAKQCGMLSYDPKKGWNCTYSDNPSDKPILFFDDYMRKNEKLDKVFENYLVFSAFAKTCYKPEIRECIDEAFDKLQRAASRDSETSIPSCKDVLESIEKGLRSELFTIRNPEDRRVAIEDQYNASSYQAWYDLPKRYTGADSLVENFELFRSVLDQLDRTGLL